MGSYASTLAVMCPDGLSGNLASAGFNVPEPDLTDNGVWCTRSVRQCDVHLAVCIARSRYGDDIHTDGLDRACLAMRVCGFLFRAGSDHRFHPTVTIRIRP